MTCQSPLAASAAAPFRPRPLEAPVTTTVGFWVEGGLLALAAGVWGSAVAAPAARTAMLLRCADSGAGARRCCTAAVGLWDE